MGFLCTHLFSVLFLDRFEVGSEIHGHFVLGAQQRAEDGVSRYTNTSKIRPLEFPPEVQHLDVQVFNLGQRFEKYSPIVLQDVLMFLKVGLDDDMMLL